ncbi:hypothetical protein C5F49_03295 [Nitrosopumilus oxyclinae]|uniref:Roadblock/LAMTOR2 domain-containing protein n=1 Tax=Nitrosopumilus oxyclinae TaxID=1959104 RepID=A0A7D5M4P0_9ARCH|nr:hypothetical protein [Nitrosopumilus oxyclinae]QLH04450.1 hypothetical protein C5F49_03295 [Nitrosopumilus oxyclinae]
MNELKIADQEKFLNSIINISGNIRYVMVYDLQGNAIHKRIMDGITDHLTERENITALQHTIESWNFRTSLSEKIGKTQYTLQVYDNLIRAIFPFGSEMLLIVTLDNAGEPGDIIRRIQTILS